MILFQKVASDKSKKTRCFYSKKGFLHCLKKSRYGNLIKERYDLHAVIDMVSQVSATTDFFTFVLTVQ